MKKNFTNEQIIYTLRQAEGGTSVAEVCRKTGITEQTFYCWKKKFGGMGVKALFDGLSNQAYVDKLVQLAGVTLSNKAQLVSALDTGQQTRAQVLRTIAESTEVFHKYYNQGFVAMQYFGYLRRDPDFNGFNEWVRVLDTSGDYRHMIFGFMYSSEYRSRFGKP